MKVSLNPDSTPLWLTGLNHQPTNYISLQESLPQPRYTPLWLTGLKAPTNQLTIYLFMTVSLNPDILLCGWLGFICSFVVDWT